MVVTHVQPTKVLDVRMDVVSKAYRWFLWVVLFWGHSKLILMFQLV